MGWASGSQLAEQMWEAISPHIDIDYLQSTAQTIIEMFEDRDADDWDYDSDLYQTAFPYGEGQFAPLLQELGDQTSSCTDKGKKTVGMMITVANKCQCSILDLIHCFVRDGNEAAEDMDAYCLDILVGCGNGYVEDISLEPPTEYPPETDENDLFYSLILLCAYAFGGAFQTGGYFEGQGFREFLAERP